MMHIFILAGLLLTAGGTVAAFSTESIPASAFTAVENTESSGSVPGCDVLPSPGPDPMVPSAQLLIQGGYSVLIYEPITDSYISCSPATLLSSANSNCRGSYVYGWSEPVALVPIGSCTFVFRDADGLPNAQGTYDGPLQPI